MTTYISKQLPPRTCSSESGSSVRWINIETHFLKFHAWAPLHFTLSFIQYLKFLTVICLSTFPTLTVPSDNFTPYYRPPCPSHDQEGAGNTYVTVRSTPVLSPSSPSTAGGTTKVGVPSPVGYPEGSGVLPSAKSQ